MAAPIPTNLCGLASPCLDPGTPFANFSAELAETAMYLGYYSGPFIPPTLGSEFSSTGCVGTCIATTSQQDADLCAQSQQVNCQVGDPAKSGGPGGGYMNPSGGPLPLFTNQFVSCSALCPDGLPFTYTVPAGRVLAFTQFQANSAALGVACSAATSRIACLSALSPATACSGSSYSGTITASGSTVDQNYSGNNWQVVAGSIPPGLTFPTGFGPPSIQITGSPIQGGNFTFTVRMTTPSGDYMQKQFTLCVVSIMPGSGGVGSYSLANGTLGLIYSQQLTPTSCASPSIMWEVVSGMLPPGITLDPAAGLLSGTPTMDGTFTFTIGIQSP
jgi:hypothetical protein